MIFGSTKMQQKHGPWFTFAFYLVYEKSTWLTQENQILHFNCYITRSRVSVFE